VTGDQRAERAGVAGEFLASSLPWFFTQFVERAPFAATASVRGPVWLTTLATIELT